jgi:hypothetical protein
MNEGRIRRHIKRTIGSKGFTKDGKIKISAVNQALNNTERKDLKKALIGTKNILKDKKRKY